MVNILLRKKIRFKKSILRSDLCDYSDAYIILKERQLWKEIMIIKKRDKKLCYKNNAPFRSCILKVNNPFIDNTEILDIVIRMYNLLECSYNYSEFVKLL